MDEKKVRYLIKQTSTSGQVRWYWQPSTRLRAQGFRPRRLSDDQKTAERQARVLNTDLDRRAVKPTRKAPPQPPAENAITGIPKAMKLKFERTQIYVIGTRDGPYKVGFSAVPFRRIAEIQTGSGNALRFFLLMDCHPVSAELVERTAHHQLRQCRLNGEWFDAPIDRVLSVVTSTWLDLLRKHHQRERDDIRCTVGNPR